MQHSDRPGILFLFSDTGGGHRSASEAIINAMNLQYPGQFDLQMVDLFREYAPPPLDLAPEIYPPLSRMPNVWKIGYRLSDGRRRTRLINSVVYPYIRRSIQHLIHDHPCNLVVSVHQLMNNPVARVLRKYPAGFATVVTDLISTHAAWYETTADLIIVPTQQAFTRGVELGIPADKIKIIGLPVSEKFRLPLKEKANLRKELGWSPDGFYVLLVGGGEGMGPIEEFAVAINQQCPKVSLAVITGRNNHLKRKLEGHKWNIPVHIYGFVNEMPGMPDLMRAADIIATKAGPGTISEALICQLPIILFSYLPGQEDGNIDYVVKEGVGHWAPEREKFLSVINEWVENPASLQAARNACRHLARPNAAREIAAKLASRAVSYYQRQQN